MTTGLATELLSRIEDAGLNASAPPQQRWLDGWLLRFSPGKAKRARCINAVADGRLPLAHKLALAEQAYRDAGLPMFVRITPFTLPASLDAVLAGQGWERIDDTRVMVAERLDSIPTPAAALDGLRWRAVDGAAFAHVIGALRGSPADQRHAHAERLAASPVPYRGWALEPDSGGEPIACGQYAVESELVGLYDVCTAPAWRGRGLAGGLCERLLAAAREHGATVGYLQVEGDNHAARAVYHRLGFADAYRYHYRVRADACDGPPTVRGA